MGRASGGDMAMGTCTAGLVVALAEPVTACVTSAASLLFSAPLAAAPDPPAAAAAARAKGACVGEESG